MIFFDLIFRIFIEEFISFGISFAIGLYYAPFGGLTWGVSILLGFLMLGSPYASHHFLKTEVSKLGES